MRSRAARGWQSRGLGPRSRTCRRCSPSLEELLQIHAGIQARDLAGVTVEHERLALGSEDTVLADAALGGLAPARMVDLRVDVRVETVLVRCGFFPGDSGLLFDEADAYDRLGALETVLPRAHEADRGAVLVRQHLIVESHRDQRERMHRLVDAQALDIRPAEPRQAHPPPGLRLIRGDELDELGLARGLDLLDQALQLEPAPGNDHCP